MDRASVTLQGRGLTDDQTVHLDVPAGRTIGKTVTFDLKGNVPPGRHILILRNADTRGSEPVDAFLALDVE